MVAAGWADAGGATSTYRPVAAWTRMEAGRRRFDFTVCCCLTLAVDAFAQIAERRIRAAMEEGAFDDLEGAGRPLDLERDRRVPRELRAVYRILEHADCLPPEVELRKEIRSLRDLLPTIRDERALEAAVRDINLKITALNVMRTRTSGRTVSGDMAQLYAQKLVDRLRDETRTSHP